MNVETKFSVRAGIALLLAVLTMVPVTLLAQSAQHVVGPADLNKAAVDSTNARQKDLSALRQFVSSEKAQQALKAAHMNPEQVKNAVSSLSDGELAQLASRVQKAQDDFAAGVLSDRDLIVILVAIAVLILIIVAVR
jgi:flagellar biosynthesis protein FliP